MGFAITETIRSRLAAGRGGLAVLDRPRRGHEQIRTGMAWHYKAYQHELPTQERLVYRDEEDASKAARRGLWKDAKPMPPSEPAQSAE